MLAFAVMTGLAGCASSPRPQAAAVLDNPNPSNCTGPATLHVDNNFTGPVDVYSSQNSVNTFLGTAQPGRSEYAVNDAGAGFFVTEVGKKTVLEGSGRVRRVTDRVQFLVVCNSN